MVIREDETLSSIKERIQKKLKVPDEDFSKVKLHSIVFLFVLIRSICCYSISCMPVDLVQK